MNYVYVVVQHMYPYVQTCLHDVRVCDICLSSHFVTVKVAMTASFNETEVLVHVLLHLNIVLSVHYDYLSSDI